MNVNEQTLVALLVVAVLVVLIIVVLRQPAAPGQGQPSIRTILLGASVALFILSALGVITGPGIAWGLACLAAAFLL
jgi:hypothetical protein